MEPTDLELVSRYRKGEKRAFEILVKRYQRKVYALACGIVQNPEDALDVAQESFVKVHRYIDKFQGSSSFYTWLYRIVVNLCIDLLRRRGKAYGVEYDDTIDRSGHVFSTEAIVPSRLGTNPSKVLQDKEILAAIQQGLEQLSPKHRAVLIMREIEGLSYREMARIMQCSKGTIMSRLFHARKRMQAYLLEHLNDESEGDV